MKKLFFLLVVAVFLLSGSNVSAQRPQPTEDGCYPSVIVADWETSPGSQNSSPGDKINYTRNPYKTGINTSAGVGIYTHKNNEWTTAEIQAGRLRRAAGIKPDMAEDIHLGYYDSFEFKQFFPAETMVSGLGSGLRVELRSDGPDRGTDPNVVRENWERQYVTYPTLPQNPDLSDMTNTWFKVERSGIISGRTLGMIQVAFRAGQAAPSNQSTIYFDDFIFHPKKTNKICTYRETFYLQCFEGQEHSWEGIPNKEFILYPGTSWQVTIQTGKERWPGHAELKSANIDMQYEAGTGRDYYLRMDNESPEILIEDIDILPGLESLQFAVDIRSRAPRIQYRLDNGDWQTIDFNSSSTAVSNVWNTFTFDISTGHANKVALKLSNEDISNGYAYIDNLTIWGTDPLYIENNTCKGVGIKELNAPAIRIYPNPVIETLHIDGDVKKTDIYDMQGHLVLSGNQKQINVSHLNAGMYVTKLHTDKGVFSSKVFKK